jgi:hypothetical protein
MTLFRSNANAWYIFASLQLAVPILASAQTLPTHQGAPHVTQRATGPFDVFMKPASPPEKEGRTAIGRMVLDKQYFGDLVAIGKGEMLTAVTDTQGSAAYVAIERITGTLNGRGGSFVIQHNGTMSGGSQNLSTSVVPDSGTEQLTGISGTLAMKVVEGKHVYALDYVLP